jgi:S1-C subfamily serine protease
VRWVLLVLALAGLGCGGGGGPEVVTVLVERRSGAPERATGFVAAPGRIVTVAHVLERGGAVSVRGRTARVVRVDRASDLALLAVGVEGTRAGGRGVRVLGAAGRTSAEVRRRITARIGAYARPALELRAEIGAGDSGAPVVDGRGRLLGVVFARSRLRDDVAYAVGARAVEDLLR